MPNKAFGVKCAFRIYLFRCFPVYVCIQIQNNMNKDKIVKAVGGIVILAIGVTIGLTIYDQVVKKHIFKA